MGDRHGGNRRVVHGHRVHGIHRVVHDLHGDGRHGDGRHEDDHRVHRVRASHGLDRRLSYVGRGRHGCRGIRRHRCGLRHLRHRRSFDGRRRHHHHCGCRQSDALQGLAFRGIRVRLVQSRSRLCRPWQHFL